jgi:hypothetical protein
MGSMTPTATRPADSSQGQETQLFVDDSSQGQETELFVEVGPPVAFAVALLAALLSAGLAIAIAAGWHPL